MPQDRIRQPTHSQQAHCRTFSDCTRGSDPNMGWNAAECKYALEALLARVFQKEATGRPRHLNRDKTRKIHRNTLRNFPLQGFNKHIHRFGCSGKGEHLNHAERQNPAVNPLTANALQEFQRLYPWFRSQLGLEHRRMQIRSGGTSERGIPERSNRTALASELKQNPRNSLQFIEILPIARLHQASPLVQMQWKREASEPCHKTESGSQPSHNKRVVRLSATAPVVQILGGVGTPQIANTLWRHFGKGYPPNAQQNSTCI